MKVAFRNIVLLVLMVIGIFAAYSNHWDNEFNFDDGHAIVNNIPIKDLSQWKTYFTDSQTYSALPTNTSYRPLVTLSVAIDYWMAGEELDVFYFHLTNFISHIALSLLLIFLFLKWIPSEVPFKWRSCIAIVAAALFGMHAFGPETVTYISSRSDSLSTLWAVITVLVFIRFAKYRKFQLFVIPFIIAFLFKQVAIVLPILIFFYILLIEENAVEIGLKNLGPKITKALKITLPSIVVAIALYFFNVKMTPAAFNVGEVTTFSYFITQPFVLTRYFTSFFFPFDLSADTDWYTLASMTDIRFIIGALFIAVMTLLIVKLSLKKKFVPIAYGLLWFFICLAPTSSVLPLSEVMNDHRVYFGNIGLCFVTVYTIYLFGNWLLEKKHISLQFKYASFFLLTGFIVFGNAFCAYERNEVWDNSVSCWKDVTEKSPRNARGLMNYGLSLVKRKPWEALAYYNRSYEISPQYTYLHINYGMLKSKLGFPTDEIEDHFNKAIQYNLPRNPDPYYWYANWLFSNYRISEAKENCEIALEFSASNQLAKELLENIKRNYPDLK